MSERYKKIDTERLAQESFKMQSYFKTLSLTQSRLQFKLISKICPTIASYYHRDPKYKKQGYMCVGCSVKKVSESPSDSLRESSSEQVNQNLDSSTHILRCSAYANLRTNLNLDLQTDMLTYVQLIIDKRLQEDAVTWKWYNYYVNMYF